MRDLWLVGTGIAFGWLMSKAWSDPQCQTGLVIFLVATAAMALAFVLAVVGHGKEPHDPRGDEDDDGA